VNGWIFFAGYMTGVVVTHIVQWFRPE